MGGVGPGFDCLELTDLRFCDRGLCGFQRARCCLSVKCGVDACVGENSKSKTHHQISFGRSLSVVLGSCFVSFCFNSVTLSHFSSQQQSRDRGVKTNTVHRPEPI